MIDKKMKEALELLGGKAIVKDNDDYFVLMTLREFKKSKQEGLGSLTKQELIDKINNDIAAWQITQASDDITKINLDELEKEAAETEVHYEKA